MKYLFNKMSYRFLKQVILLGVILSSLQMKVQIDLQSETNVVSNTNEANFALGWSGSVDFEIDSIKYFNVNFSNSL